MAIKYSTEDIYNAFLEKISNEIREACLDDSKLEQLIKKYNLFEDEETAYYDEDNLKVLIVGELSFPKDVLYTIAKKEFNISNEKIDMLNYQEAKHYDFQRLKGYSKYTDIIVGPNAHKSGGIDGYNSLISMIKSEQEKFPLLTEAVDSTGKLKFTKTSIRTAFAKTKIARLLA